MKEKNQEHVRIWLWLGVLMVLVQFLLGSITRLTESGLSITEWKVVTGIVYPYTDEMWIHEFDLYKQMPQYVKINEGMSLEDFKFIYFWEFFHRFWARFIAFVFLIPFLYFLYKNLISKKLLLQLGILFGLGILEASIGWIMVKSGLMDRPWVNAYKLSLHLCFATIILAYMYWIVWNYGRTITSIKSSNYYLLLVLSIMFFIQIFLGGVMSGMRAGLVAPTWPDINGSMIPNELGLLLAIKENIINTYEENHISGIIIQFVHRGWAYLISIISLIVFWKNRVKLRISFKDPYFLFGSLLLIQIILGIFTVINCVGKIPITLGVLHQMCGIITFLVCLDLLFKNTFAEKKDIKM